MTTKHKIEFECNCCDGEFEDYVIMSTNEFGSSDLDCRPAEMMRSTMACWVHECPHCGYIDDGEDEDDRWLRSFIGSEEYKECEGIVFGNDIAGKFYRYALIQLKKNRFEEACSNFLRAAWGCDDSGESGNAVKCRIKFLEVFDKLQDVDDNLSLTRVDVLRRVGEFNAVLEEYKKCKFGDDLMNQILEFQKEKCVQKNTDCFTVGEVIDGKP
ncbi:MAG: hypothetical protein Q4C25_02250 [Bacillota bacterium]|nr:hypothetical protein [Bacillota bacterium]